MMHSLRSTIWLLVFMARTMTATAQEAEENGIVHMQVQRLNDSYIDVYHNKPTKDSMPIMIFCQGSGYDSNTCLLYTSPSPRDQRGSRMPSSA